MLSTPGSQPNIFHVVCLLQIYKSLPLFCPFWTKNLDYTLGAKRNCIFTLGAEAAFSWCLHYICIAKYNIYNLNIWQRIYG